MQAQAVMELQHDNQTQTRADMSQVNLNQDQALAQTT